MSSDPSIKGARYPRRIGRYEVLKHIGAGGMAAVYKAVDASLGREVALKVLPTELAARPDLVERFQREAQHAAKLRYKHIVTVYECGEDNGIYFLAMEYVDGSNLLEHILRKGRLDAEEARRVLIQAAKALAHAHKQGIIHRDVKPSNFLLKQKGGRLFVKLTDFGLARTTADSEFQITRAGSTIGTVDYIAPEQARNSRAADIRSDIYSLGCTLYHMLAGRPPFPEGDLAERLLKRIEHDPPDVRQFSPDVPEELVSVLKRMMEKKPQDRYQTPQELLRDLKQTASSWDIPNRELLEGLAQPNGETPAFKDRRRRPRQNRSEYPEVDTDSRFPLPGMLSGWKLWAVVVGGVLLVTLILLALALGWDFR